ncbi:MAG: spore germination protein [Paenibacillaceae bacterium]|jgi:spore germination protein|nr:spore germination protein [Paenibacillaceae bacterium]
MEIISNRQAKLLGIILAIDGMLVSLPNKVFQLSARDAWMAYLLAYLIVMVLLWMQIRTTSRFPGKNLFQIMVQRHPVVGRALVLPVLLFMFLVIIRDVRTLSEFVTVELLAYTPVPVISALIVLAVVVTVSSRFEVISRMCEIWLPLVLVFLALVPVLLFPEFEIRHTLPILEKGFVPVIQGSWYTVAAMGQILLLPFLLPSAQLRMKDGIYGLSIAWVTMEWLNLCILLSMGSAVASKLQNPFYEMVRLIRVTDFLDRFELPLDMVYVPLMITKVAFFLFAFMYGMEQLIPALHMDKLVLSFGACCFSFSFWFFRNASQLFSFLRTLSLFALILEVGLTCLIFVLFRPKQNVPGGSSPGST